MTNKTIVDCSNGEINVVAMTEEEIFEMKQRQDFLAEEEEKQKAASLLMIEARSSAESKLAALGLTSEEIAALYN